MLTVHEPQPHGFFHALLDIWYMNSLGEDVLRRLAAGITANQNLRPQGPHSFFSGIFVSEQYGTCAIVDHVCYDNKRKNCSSAPLSPGSFKKSGLGIRLVMKHVHHCPSMSMPDISISVTSLRWGSRTERKPQWSSLRKIGWKKKPWGMNRKKL